MGCIDSCIGEKMKKIMLFLLMWLCWLSPAQAEEIKRVAILEFRGVGIDEEVLFKLSDQSRIAAIEALPKEEYSIMTRENMMMVLEDMGKDASCMEGSCEVDIARNIGADFVVTGSVMKVDEQYLLTLKLHETRSGKLLAGKELRKDQVLELVDETKLMSLYLFGEGFDIDVGLKKFSASKTMYWVGSGLLVTSGVMGGIAVNSKNQYVDAEDVATAQSLDTTNRITATAFPILLGLSATTYTLGWFTSRKER